MNHLSAAKYLTAALILVAMLKAWLLWQLPLTGDEAYFIVWGQQLEWGYYDHPPAVGWLLFVMSHLWDNLYFYRSFAYFGSMLLAWVLYRWLRLEGFNAEKSLLVALIFWLSPVSLIFVLTTNDTVLVVTGVLGLYLFARALQSNHLGYGFAAGVFLGLAFLSKYFAAFMLIGVLLFVVVYRQQVPWRVVIVTASVVLLAVAENLYFNYHNCWNNILFNFFSRTRESELQFGTLLEFLAMLVLMLTPWALWMWGRYRESTLKQGFALSRDGALSPLWLYATLPLFAILLLASLSNPVGLHWGLLGLSVLSGLLVLMQKNALRHLLKWHLLFAVTALVVVNVSLVFLPHFLSSNQVQKAAPYLQPQSLCAQLPMGEWFTLDYSSQSMLSYHCQNNDIHVFASQSKYGREDDKRINFAEYDGKTLHILLLKPSRLERIQPYFAQVSIQPLAPVMGVSYQWVRAEGFDYAAYQQDVLNPVRQKFYTPPDWLQKILPNAQCQM